MQDNEFFNTYFSGTMTMQVVFESEEADRMKDPEVLTAMQDLQAYAETFEFVGSSQSLADIIEEMHFVMSGNSGEHNLLPESRKLVSQYLLLYSLTGDDKTIENLVNYNYSAANLTLFMKSSNLTKMLNFEKDIEHYIHKNINLNGITITPTGRITAMSVLSNLIVKSQLLSITVSLLLVLLITSTLLRSFILGMISTIPILITLLVNFGLMGYFDLPLDMATVLIASVAIGIGIDYSIHYITHYISERAKGNPDIPFSPAQSPDHRQGYRVQRPLGRCRLPRAHLQQPCKYRDPRDDDCAYHGSCLLRLPYHHPCNPLCSGQKRLA